MTRCIRLLSFAVASGITVACSGAREIPRDVRVVEYRNARWFDGDSFEPATWYAVGDRLSSRRPSRVDDTVDLAQKFVVPPYGEGHNHWLEPAAVDAYVQSYLRDGVFYLRDQANAPSIRARLDSSLNRPASVDFISANQGFTGRGGHPAQIARQFLVFGSFPAGWTEKDLEGGVYFSIDSAPDIDRAWPKFIAGKPDFLKLFLLYSEQYDSRRGDSSYLYRRGMNPALVPPLVKRAHDAGLRVSAHVYTAADFHNALAGGVDAIAHMPGTGYDSTMGPAAFRISDEDAALAGSRSVSVTTTLSWLAELDSSTRTRVVAQVIRPNVELLRKHRVAILIGSDQFRGTPAQEVDILHSLGLFTPAELLRMWSMDTPRSIFPRRDIGGFAEGFEASFLVLDTNPLDDFANAHIIRMRVQRGSHLPAPRAVEFPSLGNQD